MSNSVCVFGLIAALSPALTGCQSAEGELLKPAAPTSYVETGPRAQPARSGRVSDGALSTDETVHVQGSGRFIADPRPTLTAASVQDKETFTVNLIGVSIVQAAKQILGDIFAVEYSIDPGLDGKITVQTPKPVSRATLLKLFQSALRANNASLIQTGGQYRIVNGEQTPVGGTLTTASTAGRRDALDSTLRAVELKYVSASDIRRILEPIAPRGSIVRVDDSRNLITLAGNTQELATLIETISIFDIDVMKGMSFAMVPVTTSQPNTIAQELTRIFGADKEGPMSGMVRFLPNKRLASILIVSPQPQYLKSGEEWVRRLDARAQSNEKQFFTYVVRNRRAQELVEVVQSMLSSDGSTTKASSIRNVTPRQQEAVVQSQGFQMASATAGGAGAASPASSTALRSAQAGTPQDAFQRSSPRATASDEGGVFGDDAKETPPIRIVADTAKNTILIETTPTQYKRLARLIERLDVIPNQVLLQATIAEVSLNDKLKFGVRWYLENKKSSYTFSDSAAGAVSSVFPGFSYALATANLMASINALNEVTDVTIVSSPSLTVMDNKTAVLQIGDQVPITTQTAVSVATTGAPVVNSITYKDTGVILSMTPQISDSGRVMLEIEQEVSSVATTSTSGIDSPTIRQRRVKTTVVVNDGEALALGGLIQKSKTVERTKMPILGDIPVLGSAFQNKQNDQAKTELIIIITPKVLRNMDEARAATEELRQEFEAQVRIDRDLNRKIHQNIRRTID